MFCVTRKRRIASTAESRMKAMISAPWTWMLQEPNPAKKPQNAPKALCVHKVDRALAREHEAELPRHDGAWDQERQETQDPPAEGGRSGALDHRRVGDEQHDGGEDRHHVERVEDLWEDPSGDPFGKQLTACGGLHGSHGRSSSSSGGWIPGRRGSRLLDLPES